MYRRSMGWYWVFGLTALAVGVLPGNPAPAAEPASGAQEAWTARAAEIKQRIEALRTAGYTQFTIQLVPGQEAALADWARIRKAFV